MLERLYSARGPGEPVTHRIASWARARLGALLSEHVWPRIPLSVRVAAGIVVGLLVLSSELHRSWPRAWPLAVLVGAPLAAGSWWRGRAPLRWFMPAVVGACAAWLGLAWLIGARTGLVMLLIAGAVLVVAGWMNRPPRGGEGGKPPSKFDAPRVVAEWPALAAAAGLPSSTAELVERDAVGATLRVELAPGRTVPEAVARLDALESALGQHGVRPGRLRVMRDPSRADRCHLRVIEHDLLAEPIPWPGPSITSIREPIPWGIFDNGSPADVSLLPKPSEGRNVLVGGVKGSGKSGLENALLASIAYCDDVVPWGIDLKHGIELSPWRGIFDRLAVEPDEAAELLSAAQRVLAARARLLARSGKAGARRAWPVGPNRPLLLILIDELARAAESMPKVFDLASRGRALGILLVLVTQRPAASTLGEGGTDVRSQADVAVAMKVARSADTNLILGEGRISEGWRADRLGAPGSFLIASPEHTEPRPARCFQVTDEQVDAVVKARAESRPRLDDISRAAAEARG